MSHFKSAIVLAAVLLATGCCHEPVSPPPIPATTGSIEEESPEYVLRSYEVPEGYGQEISSTLANLLDLNDQQVGGVTLAPNNRVLVVASEPIQAGVAELLDNLDLDDPAALESSIRVDYWLVLGQPAESESNTQGFAEIAPALAEISSAQGPMTFVLLDRLTLLSTEYSRASANGRHLSVRQGHRRVGDDLVLELSVDSGNNSITTAARVRPGQLTVLGQVGYRPDTFRPPSPGDGDTSADQMDDGMLFYVIRASVVTP